MPTDKICLVFHAFRVSSFDHIDWSLQDNIRESIIRASESAHQFQLHLAYTHLLTMWQPERGHSPALTLSASLLAGAVATLNMIIAALTGFGHPISAMPSTLPL